ncbi:rhomboid family intramembrane serine protease [Ferruginibacter profundus]
MEELSQFPVTFSIIALTVVVSLVGFSNHDLKNKAIFYPYGMNAPSEYYRFLSHGLIHADFIHLFFNMFTLYSFGRFVEIELFNKSEYVILYVTALAVASVYDFIKNRNNPSYAALGASGAVSAVLFSSIIFDPWAKNVALFDLISLPNIVFAVLYLWYCIYSSRRGGDNIGHNAHFSGSIYGFVFAAILRPELFKGFIEKLIHPSF